ncbi:Hypothetical protein I596_3636 [Dokdonella koreensis DS-123]|uniref:DUF3703 domain-containing protein n=2 Tax=Dokdonella TaxID=323413 RepID=A0A160DYD9_9GAMM|nr:Hypothetical protein I596_3636 [Dokdonella koreensis DS-123]
MPSFTRAIRPYVDAELQAADRALAEDDATRAFVHLERAHVLGQASTIEHVRVHVRMLYWGFAQRNLREVLGQLLRIAGAATKTVFGLVPHGNTGGADISPFRRMPVPPDLDALIRHARER